MLIYRRLICDFFFFFNDTATTEIYTLSLHDALPIFEALATGDQRGLEEVLAGEVQLRALLPGRYLEVTGDRKSTRLNSSHGYISYAVFCLKKKKVASCMSPMMLLRMMLTVLRLYASR